MGTHRFWFCVWMWFRIWRGIWSLKVEEEEAAAMAAIWPYSHYSHQPSDIGHRTPWTSHLDGVSNGQWSELKSPMPHRAPIAMLMYLEIVPRAVGSPSLDVSFALCLRGDLRKPEWKAFSGRNECEMLFGFGKIGWGTQKTL